MGGAPKIIGYSKDLGSGMIMTGRELLFIDISFNSRRGRLLAVENIPKFRIPHDIYPHSAPRRQTSKAGDLEDNRLCDEWEDPILIYKFVELGIQEERFSCELEICRSIYLIGE